MTTPLYIRIRNPDNGARVVDDLLQIGLAPERIHLYGKHIPAGLPVSSTRWPRSNASTATNTLIGAGVLAGLGVIVLGHVGPDTLLLALLGAGLGASWDRLRDRGKETRLAAQREPLRRGDLMIVADIDDDAVAQMESQIAERHPEVILLGPDASGSPPFP